MNELPSLLTRLFVGARIYKVTDRKPEKRPWQNRRPWEPAAESTHGPAIPTGTLPSTARHVGRRARPGAADPGFQAACKSS